MAAEPFHIRTGSTWEISKIFSKNLGGLNLVGGGPNFNFFWGNCAKFELLERKRRIMRKEDKGRGRRLLQLFLVAALASESLPGLDPGGDLSQEGKRT